MDCALEALETFEALDPDRENDPYVRDKYIIG